MIELDRTSRPRGARRDISSDRIPLPGSRWSLWPAVCLRGTGFPVSGILPFSSTTSAELARRLIDAGATAGATTPSGDVAAERAALAETFAAEMRRIRSVLRDVARQPEFREAVLWQNPAALPSAVDAFTSASVDTVNAATRRRTLVVASYVQRYLTKNDTIGFFGPVGWAHIRRAAPAIAVTCGPTLTSARRGYVESWSIDAIARALDRDPALRPWRVPCIAPFFYLDGSRLVTGRRAVCYLSRDHVRLLMACDGRDNARTIAALLMADGGAFTTTESIYTVLDQWQQAGYITWTLEGPRELHAERTLRRRLEQIDEAGVRARSLDALDRYDAAVRCVRDTAGDVDALGRALADLESTFTSATSVAATRREGQMYAARTLVYEECLRDAHVEIGAALVARLSRPLVLMLQSARWAMHELSRRYAAEFRRAYDQLARASDGPVGLGAFLGKTSLRQATSGAVPLVPEVRAELQHRWASVLAIPSGARRVHYRSRDIRAAVGAVFPSSGEPPSSWTRYLSPDLMIDAPSVAAIQRGDCRFVLGEIHPFNTLLQATLLDQYPQQQTILEWLDRDAPEPRVIWTRPKDMMPQRVQYALRPTDVAYMAAAEPSPAPPERTIRLADLVVVDENGTLVVRQRDGRWRFTCLEFVGSIMMRTGGALFHLLPTDRHQPRVTIDDLVVAREQWQMPASALTFAAQGSELDRYVECQRWARECGMPQFVFVKMSTERKPIYVDLSSPLFVELFARFVRGAERQDPSARVTISEMLPAPSGAWLPDADGETYTCELRMVAVEPA